MLRFKRSNPRARVVALSIAATTVAFPFCASAATLALRYVGTREHSFSGTPQTKALDERFTVVDDVTIARNGNGILRTEKLDFTPDGIVKEPDSAQVARRTFDERIDRSGARGVAVTIAKESTTLDHSTIFPNIHEFDAAQNETTDIVYDRPRIAVLMTREHETLHNAIARSIDVESASQTFTARVSADGSVQSTGRASPAFEKLTQNADGSASYHFNAVGFSLYDLDAAAPEDGPSGMVIHVSRERQGRTVGPAPITTDDFTVADWYPGGKLGPDRDDVTALGVVALPNACASRSNARSAYASQERRSMTRFYGLVETIATTTYVRGDTVVCSLETTVTKMFDPTTGMLVSTDADTLVLHVAVPPSDAARSVATAASISLHLSGERNRKPWASTIDPRAVGPAAEILGIGRDGYAALRRTPER